MRACESRSSYSEGGSGSYVSSSINRSPNLSPAGRVCDELGKSNLVMRSLSCSELIGPCEATSAGVPTFVSAVVFAVGTSNSVRSGDALAVPAWLTTRLINGDITTVPSLESLCESGVGEGGRDVIHNFGYCAIDVRRDILISLGVIGASRGRRGDRDE